MGVKVVIQRILNTAKVQTHTSWNIEEENFRCWRIGSEMFWQW
jgi:hypothetical protein